MPSVLELNRCRAWRNEFPYPLGPLHRDDGLVVAECFIKAEALGFGNAFKAIGVNMDKMTQRLKPFGKSIPFHQDKGWTLDFFANAEGLGQPLNKRCFARAEFAGKCQYNGAVFRFNNAIQHVFSYALGLQTALT